MLTYKLTSVSNNDYKYYPEKVYINKVFLEDPEVVRTILFDTYWLLPLILIINYEFSLIRVFINIDNFAV